MNNTDKRKYKILKFKVKSPFFSIFYLVNRNYFKNYMLIFTNFLLPSIIFVIFWFIYDKPGDEIKIIPLLLPGLASSGIFSVGLVSFSSVVSSWKRSVIFKKLKASRIPNWYLPLALLIFYFIISFISFWIVIFFSIFLNEMSILYNEKTQNLKENREILNIVLSLNFNFWIGIFSNISISCLIGLLIGYISFNEISAQAIGLSTMLFSAFLLGCYVPPSLLIDSDILTYTSLGMPHFSSIRLIQISWFENENFIKNDVFDFKFIKDEYYLIWKGEKFKFLIIKMIYIYLLIPSWILLFGILNLFVFKYKKNK